MDEQPTYVSGHDAGAPFAVPPPLVPPVLPATSPGLSNLAVCKPKIWGAWATLGLGLALLLAHVMAQAFGVIPFMLFHAAKGEAVDPTALGTNGLVLAVATIIATPVSVGLAFLFTRIRAGSWKEACACLGLRAVPLRAYIWSLVTLTGVLLMWMGYAKLTNKPDVPQVMVDMYRSAGVYPLFWAAIILAAPIAEEVIFRGFFFSGLRHSALGAPGAIVLPSVFWASIHLQYGLGEIAFIFLFGLFLGVLRLRTHSLWPPMLVHALSNLLSTIEVACLTGSGG